METQSSGSTLAPKIKKPRLNFSNVHREYDQIEIFNARKQRNVAGSRCKECKQSFLDRNSTNLKAHLKSQHPEIYKVIQSKSLIVFIDIQFFAIYLFILIILGLDLNAVEKAVDSTYKESTHVVGVSKTMSLRRGEVCFERNCRDYRLL